MSNDIVERLRFKVPLLVPIVDTMKEAADEIEQADNERLVFLRAARRLGGASLTGRGRPRPQGMPTGASAFLEYRGVLGGTPLTF